MSQTAAIVLIGVTVLCLLLVTIGGIHYLSDVLGGEDEHDDHGGAAH
ncbi:hypothetical protein [Halorarius litoreus]|nr:hypothetical protein [Halorarius litoreus]